MIEPGYRLSELARSIGDDFRYAARSLARRPGLATVTTFALTIGIAANAIMFGIVDQLLLRPPAGIAEPEQVRRIYYRVDLDGKFADLPATGYPALAALRNNTTAADVAFALLTSFTLGHGSDAASVDARVVSGNYFQILGVRPQLGRTFTHEEDESTQGVLVVVVSDAFWRTTLGGRANVLSEQLEIDGKMFTIVGVAPPSLEDIDRHKVDVWIPAPRAAGRFGIKWNSRWDAWWFQGLVRLAPGVRHELVESQMTAAYRQRAELESEGGKDTTTRVLLGPLSSARGPQGLNAVAKVSLWLMGVSVIVLLIACSNVANVLIARTIQRRRELSVRLALGISRARLLRLLLTESALLAATAMSVALVVAQWGRRLVQNLLLPGSTWSNDVFDLRVIAFAMVGALICVVFIGLAPALHAVRTNVSDGLKATARQVAGGPNAMRTTLLVTQAALSVVLLVAAGLFVRSLHNLTGRDVGITLNRVMLVSLDRRRGVADSLTERLFTTAAHRIRELPGVVGAAVVAQSVPMRSAGSLSLHIPGVRRLPPVNDGGGAYGMRVRNDFFAVVGASIRAGRLFTAQEEQTPARVMLVNETLARAYWPNRSPIGTCVRVGLDSACTEIVGVVQDIMMFSVVKMERAIGYLPPLHPANSGFRRMSALLVRTQADPAAVVAPVRAELQRLAVNLPYIDAMPFSQLVEPQIRPWRLGATMFSLFGVVALIIATVGLYSVLAFWVSQRTQEIGVRMALGARDADIVRLVVGQASRPIVIGLVLGGVAAAVGARWMREMLFETSTNDPLVYAAAGAVLGIAAVAACVVPAWRSATVDPASALRAE